MALRTYSDEEGGEWRVWRVAPEAISFATLSETYRHGWLCFERVDGSERRRLSMTEVPAEWDALSDERLDLLRRVAEPGTRRSITGRGAASDTDAMENAQCDSRSSGPRRVFGGEEARD